jgi:hypothetical protein
VRGVFKSEKSSSTLSLNRSDWETSGDEWRAGRRGVEELDVLVRIRLAFGALNGALKLETLFLSVEAHLASSG